MTYREITPKNANKRWGKNVQAYIVWDGNRNSLETMLAMWFRANTPDELAYGTKLESSIRNPFSINHLQKENIVSFSGGSHGNIPLGAPEGTGEKHFVDIRGFLAVDGRWWFSLEMSKAVAYLGG